MACSGSACNLTCNAEGGCAGGYFCTDIVDEQGTCVEALPRGTPCDAGDQCTSGLCATGFCCADACPKGSSSDCAPFGCSDAGACLYPSEDTVCASSCTGSTLNSGACDGTGNCIDAGAPCPYNYACNDLGTACLDHCGSDVDCAMGFHCNGQGECF